MPSSLPAGFQSGIIKAEETEVLWPLFLKNDFDYLFVHQGEVEKDTSHPPTHSLKASSGWDWASTKAGRNSNQIFRMDDGDPTA